MMCENGAVMGICVKDLKGQALGAEAIDLQLRSLLGGCIGC